MRPRRLKPTSSPFDAILLVTIAGALVGGGYAVGVGWSAAAGVIVVVAELAIRQLRRHRSGAQDRPGSSSG
jgi:hypothetical protein